MNLHYIIWLLLLVLIVASIMPQPSRETFTVDTCPNLDLSYSDEPSCLEMIKKVNGMNEQSIVSQYGPGGLTFLSTLNTYRFKTPDAEGIYGTGKCIIPKEAKELLGIDATCRGTNAEGRTIQLKTVPKNCQKFNYGDSELSSLYDGCILERGTLPQFFEYAGQVLNEARDETIDVEQQENKDRYDYNQNLLQQTDTTIQQRQVITQQGNELKAAAENAIGQTQQQASLESDYNREQNANKNAASQYMNQNTATKEQNDFLFNTSRADITFDRVSFTIPQGAATIYDLGPANMSPWTSWGVNRNFPDQSARWIWPERYAAWSASSRKYYVYKEYNHTGGQPFSAIVQTVIDNDGEIYWNNVYIGGVSGTGGNGRYNQHTVSVRPGINLLTYHVHNGGGPAGLLVSVVNDANQVLFRTDSSWKWSYG